MKDLGKSKVVRYSEEAVETFRKSLKEFDAVLAGKEMTDVTRGSLAMISNFAKMRQTEAHEMGIEFATKRLELTELKKLK